MFLTVLPFGRQQLVFSSLLQAVTVSGQIGVLYLLLSDRFGESMTFQIWCLSPFCGSNPSTPICAELRGYSGIDAENK